MKKSLSYILTLTMILMLCSSLFGCEKSYDDKFYDFFYKCDSDGQFNAITIEFGEDINGVYYIDGNYGVILDHGSKYLFHFFYDKEIGLYYLQSRYYNAGVGRFVNADEPEIFNNTINTVSISINKFCYHS